MVYGDAVYMQKWWQAISKKMHLQRFLLWCNRNLWIQAQKLHHTILLAVVNVVSVHVLFRPLSASFAQSK